MWPSFAFKTELNSSYHFQRFFNVVGRQCCCHFCTLKYRSAAGGNFPLTEDSYLRHVSLLEPITSLPDGQQCKFLKCLKVFCPAHNAYSVLAFCGYILFYLWIKLWNLLLFCPLCVVCSTYWFSDLTKELVTANFVANVGLLISAANCLLWLETMLMAAGRLNCPRAAEIKKMLNCCIHQ